MGPHLTRSRYAGTLHGQPGELQDTYAVGISTGLLAAAAIALSPAVPALIPLGVKVVLIAFRTGLRVGTVADLLDLQRNGTSWALTLPGMTGAEARRALSNFHKEKVVKFPSLRDLWINCEFRVYRYQIMPTSALFTTSRLGLVGLHQP